MLVERHFPHLPIRNFNLSYPYQTVAAFLPSTYGAGDENRTHNISLEGCNFTTKLHPHLQSALIVTCFRNVVLKRLLRHFKNKMLLKISTQTFLFKFAVASYGRHSRILTRDPLLPRQVRYQTALYAVKLAEVNGLEPLFQESKSCFLPLEDTSIWRAVRESNP